MTAPFRKGVIVREPFKRLSDDEIKILDKASKDILENLGLQCFNEEAADIFSKNGCEISKHDEETGKMVRNLMIMWEDIPSITDKSLQEVLPAVELKQFAIAMYGADEEIVQKIRSNISNRAAESIDEEMSLMQDPLEEEILEAREQVIQPIRDANEKGILRRVKR